MTAEAATTSVTIFRGTTENQFGDAVDQNLVHMAGVPAILTETGRRIEDPSSPTPRTIRAIECHVPPWTGVLNTDRIYDEQTGDTYIVQGVTRPPTLIGAPPDTLLQLKRITASGT
jgi:hypothetical protein